MPELCAEHPDVVIDAVSSAGRPPELRAAGPGGGGLLRPAQYRQPGPGLHGPGADHQEIYRLSGKWATEDFGAAKLLGLRKVYPEMYDKIGCVLSLSEWIAWMFTGETVMEYSQACETQLYDIGRRTWSEELCRKYGLETDILPPLAAGRHRSGPPCCRGCVRSCTWLRTRRSSWAAPIPRWPCGRPASVPAISPWCPAPPPRW